MAKVEKGARRGLAHTSVYLANVGQRQPDLVPIQRLSSCLKRVALEIDRLQPLLILEMLLDIIEISELIVASPDLLEILQRADALQTGDLVVGYLQNSQLGVGLQTG